MADDTVLTERLDDVLVIALNRPEVLNAFNRRQAVELSAALDSFEADASLRVGVLTGAGEAFCTGSDLKATLAGESTVVPPRGFYGMLEHPPRKPMVAAIEGYALGGGCELALACDLIVASETAKFGLPEVRWGVLASSGGLFRLPQRIPYHWAMELALTGASIPAARAAALGLVNRVVPAGEAVRAAVELAQQIAGNAPVAVLASKRAIMQAFDLASEEAWTLQRQLDAEVMRSDDSKEGLAAFKEKRTPIWRGS